MSDKTNYTGQIFGKLSVVKHISNDPKNGRKRVLCKCSCKDKTLVKVVIKALKSGNTKSCGCSRKDSIVTHGLKKHPLYRAWYAMLYRCYDENCAAYSNYGGRGIKVCKEWKNRLTGIGAFIAWNNSLPKSKQWSKGLDLDRKNNDKGYYPWNCRWVTRKVNSNNKRLTIKIEYKGRVYTPTDIVSKFAIEGVSDDIFRKRLKRGWSVSKSLFTPILINQYV